jgi:hypothetical protein
MVVVEMVESQSLNWGPWQLMEHDALVRNGNW